MTNDYNDVFSCFGNIHDENLWTSDLVEKASELVLIEKDDVNKAILIDLLASFERKAWDCRVAAERRKKLRPLFKNLLKPESLIKLIESKSTEIRYALAKYLACVVITNDEMRTKAETLKDISPYPFQLLWCRRLLSFLTKYSRQLCGQCSINISTAAFVFDQQSSLDLLFGIWRNCFIDCLTNRGSINDDCLIDLLATSHDLLDNELTSRRTVDIIISLWPQHGKSLLDLLSSSNRLIIRHTLDLFYAILSIIFHDCCMTYTSRWTLAESVITSLVSFTSLNANLFATSTVMVDSWFGGVLGNDQSGIDCNISRLWMLLPILAQAIACLLRDNMISGSDSANCSDAVSMDPHRLVELLIEQDDHFCDFFLCLVIISRYYKCGYDVHDIWLNFLNHINWTYDLVLDWIISSETLFLQAFTRYLKQILHDPSALLAKCAAFRVPIKSNEDVRAPVDDSGPEFVILEVIGGETSERKVYLKQLRKMKMESKAGDIFMTVDISQKLFKFFDDIYIKLNRLHKANVISFNVRPLINLLLRIIKLK